MRTARRVIMYGLMGFGLIIGCLLFRPAMHLLHTSKHTRTNLPALSKGYADDVSRLNKTRIDSLVQVATDSAGAIGQLTELLAYARQQHLPVSIAGARHSMGGHTIAPAGIQINMLPFKKMALDRTNGVLSVGTGALWSEVIPYLNQYGRSVSIMQSDNAFSVGGSISVNCHGWQHNRPPIAATVVAFQLLKADGTLVNCSRKENQALFSLALGGYGLFGIILQVQLQTVPNELYTYHRLVIPSSEYLRSYQQYVDENPKVRMVYGRLNVNREGFLERATLNYFEFERPLDADYPLSNPGFTELKRSIFIGSKQDDYGKKLRWDAEQLFTKTMIGSEHSRNQIMNESPLLYLNQSVDRTDILHEYFIPRKNFPLFIHRLQEIVPRHQADLLNVTIRNVYKDEDTYLKYAHEEVFAFVMFFNQALTPEAENDMKALTQELVKAAHDLRGVYYLPYRLHASPEQLQQAYPMSKEFFRQKLLYDPEAVFQNKFYQNYLLSSQPKALHSHP